MMGMGMGMGLPGADPEQAQYAFVDPIQPQAPYPTRQEIEEGYRQRQQLIRDELDRNLALAEEARKQDWINFVEQARHEEPLVFRNPRKVVHIPAAPDHELRFRTDQPSRIPVRKDWEIKPTTLYGRGRFHTLSSHQSRIQSETKYKRFL